MFCVTQIPQRQSQVQIIISLMRDRRLTSGLAHSRLRQLSVSPSHTSRQLSVMY